MPFQDHYQLTNKTAHDRKKMDKALTQTVNEDMLRNPPGYATTHEVV